MHSMSRLGAWPCTPCRHEQAGGVALHSMQAWAGWGQALHSVQAWAGWGRGLALHARGVALHMHMCRMGAWPCISRHGQAGGMAVHSRRGICTCADWGRGLALRLGVWPCTPCIYAHVQARGVALHFQAWAGWGCGLALRGARHGQAGGVFIKIGVASEQDKKETALPFKGRTTSRV